MTEISRLMMPNTKASKRLQLSPMAVSDAARSTLSGKRPRRFSVVMSVWLGLISGCALSTSGGVDTSTLPSRLVSINDFTYAGAFAIPDKSYGESSANYAEGIIEANGDSLFFVGHSHQNAVAEFAIPPLVNSQSIADLRYAGPPRQVFTRLLDRVPGGNPEALDRIVGLEVINGGLVANALEYYDAPADNRLTTFTVDNASSIADSAVSGFYSMKGEARAAGWISSVPAEWRQALGCSHISGNSSGNPIISRLSVGPSAFCVNLDQLPARAPKGRIKSRELLGFSLARPLERDLNNEQGNNNLWTHLSEARYGFIIPGTSTYATIGRSGGHRSGVGYKLDRGANGQCPGTCSADPADVYNYYWFWDMRDLMRVKNGRLPSSAVVPYESGVFNVPFQTAEFINPIGGGSYDEQSGTLYLSVRDANNTLGEYSNPPVIVAYKIGAR